MTLRVAGGPVRGRRIRGAGDPVLRAGGIYLANAGTGLLLPGFAYARSGVDLWCPRDDGSLASFGANVLPREWANGRWGFRFDPGWKNFWLTRGGPVAGVFSDGTVADASGMPCARFTPNSGAQNFPSFGRSPEPFTAANGATVDIALSGYIYPSVQGAVSLDPNIVIEINTSPSANPSYTTLQIASANGSVQSKSLGLGVTERQPLSITQVGNGYKFEWVLTYTQGATLRNQVLAYVQARTTAGSGSYTADGVAAIQYSMLSASLSSYIVPSTVASNSAVSVGNFSAGWGASVLPFALAGGFSFGGACTALNRIAAQFPSVINFRPDGVSGSNETVEVFVPPTSRQLFALVRTAGGDSYGQNYVSLQDRNRFSMRAAPNNFRSAFNGQLQAEDLVGSMPATNYIQVGRNGTANLGAMQIHDLWVTKRLLPGAELTALSA